MMKRIAILAVMFVSVVGMAQDKNKKTTFEVDGKCEMCKMRIEKAALGVTGVKYASWDIPTHQLSLVVDERKANSMQIKSAIAAVGHDTKELKATQEAYDAVHPCCKYREDNTDDSTTHKNDNP
ncbi:heavy-metal-associated domain-containing protein [Muricauda sp. 334s03]|uniref:Heavy-metal-associated domain-containing protein n=1 Tax=Flagellimonas yonaguniensis TaxID=3031325 RepID=A0ABT5XW23_9FLAO|nr:heavy-metal-associated domain-containing protein [[Muricauda] yonaguniensis]MDF0715273.1 heavy-metal-associated domain-containing protein [[Muricauda] yonaguniensis]